MNQNRICNMCLGELKKLENNIYQCESCGKKYEHITQTEEEIILLIEANKTLRLGRFDDAYTEFKNIVSKYPKSYEAYFGMLLSKHGIIYVDDLLENKKVPTCYNITNNSLLKDEDYEKSLKYAPTDIKNNYIKLVEQIESIRKEWFNKASNEPPYDIFLSFKQSDRENGIEKTKDYYTALELYNYLTYKCGYRVFFSPESLKNKIAERYEPYIYGALNSAKIMIVYGQKAEYINSTWVRNEWIRYLKKIKDKEKKENSLIVCYENFDAYNLPKELVNLQALNASNKDFLNTLLYHIDKVINSYPNYIKIERKTVNNIIVPINKPIEIIEFKPRELGTNIRNTQNQNIEKLIQSASLLLKSKDFQNSKILINQILESEPNNSDALYLDFLIEQNVTSSNELESKLNNGHIIHTYVFENLFKTLKIEKSIEIIGIIKNVIRNFISHNSSLEENYILTLYKFITLYEYKGKIAFNHKVLNEVSNRIDFLLIFSYAIKLLESNDISRYISYYFNLFEALNNNKLKFDDKAKFNKKYILEAFDIDIENVGELRKYVLDQILLVDNTNKDAILLMYGITLDTKYLERDLSLTKSKPELLGRISVYLDKYLKSYKSYYEEIIKYIPEDENEFFLTAVINRYENLKSLIYSRKDDDLFNVILKYNKIIRSLKEDTNQLRFEYLIYSIRCVDEQNVIRSGIILNTLSNYLELFTSFNEEYQNKILNIINKQIEYNNMIEQKKKEKEENTKKLIEEENNKKAEEEQHNKDNRKALILTILSFIVFGIDVLFTFLLQDEGYSSIILNFICLGIIFILSFFTGNKANDLQGFLFYASMAMIIVGINATSC